MRWWGRVLVVATIVLTALGILAPMLWLATNRQVTVFLVIAAVSMWVILIPSYLATISWLRRNLDQLMSKGIWVSDRLTGNTEDDIDKQEERIRVWDTSVEKVLKGTEYEYSWRFNVGLTKPEDEANVKGPEQFLIVQRNYMALRLIRLKEIRDSL